MTGNKDKKIEARFIQHHFWGASKSGAGFTLLEMIISMGIFSVVVVTSIAITLSIKVSQEKTTNVQDVQDNIRYAMEFMTKELRQGSAYEPLPAGCNTTNNPCNKIKFMKSIAGSSQVVWYCLVDKVIYRAVSQYDLCDANNAVALTSNEDVEISKLLFYVVGNAPGASDGQPRTTVAITGNSVDQRTQLQSYFRLQTTVTQRLRDGISVPAVVGFWRFNTGSGAFAFDSSSFGNRGTLINSPVWTSDSKIGNALSFNGSSAYVDVPDDPVGTLDPATITIAAWIKIPSPLTSNGSVVAKGGTSGYRFRINTTGTVRWTDRGLTNAMQSIGVIPLNTWTHIAVTGGSSGLKIYLNGVFDNSKTDIPYGGPNTLSSLKIGAETTVTPTEYFNGIIDEVRIYNQVLTAQQIQTIMVSP